MVFTLGSFVLVTVAVAFVSWLKTKGTDETSKDGYFLGGRSLSGLVIFGSLMMTNLSAEQLVGRNGQGYAAGMTAMGWETMCPIALTLMALFFIPKYFKLGISTIPEFLESRFDRATRVIVSFIFLVAYIVTMLPLVLYAGSVAMERIFGITALMGGNRFMATTVMCVALGIIGGIYAIFGGLKAVAVSDSLNGIIFIIGAVILIPVLAFIALGDGSIAEGIRIFATSSPEHLNAIQPADAQPPYIPWPMIVLGCGINHISYWCTNQSIMQRVLGAKNLKEAQKGSLLTGLTCVFCPIFLVAPGVIQFIRDGGVLTDFDMAYPSLIKDILPTPVLGFFAAVMFGAILSSFNSVLNSSMTLFTLQEEAHGRAADHHGKAFRHRAVSGIHHYRTVSAVSAGRYQHLPQSDVGLLRRSGSGHRCYGYSGSAHAELRTEGCHHCPYRMLWPDDEPSAVPLPVL